jgi:hypothetical protein
MAPEKNSIYGVQNDTVAKALHHVETASLAQKYVKKSFRISEKPTVNATTATPTVPASNQTLSAIKP